MRYALILAGGSGTRLWPLSRADRPKQLVPLSGGSCLLEEAYNRLEGLVPEERRFVCGSERHRAAALALIPGLASPSASGLDRYLGESEGRDTLAALALSAAVLSREDPEAVMAVFTSDHLIEPAAGLRELTERAYRIVEASPRSLLTFGVEPDSPATGFGYLELSGEAEGGARQLSRFLEKPDAEQARAFLEAGPGRYLWNSGIFVWKASFFLELARKYEPELASGARALAREAGRQGFQDALARAYPGFKKISVDYGIMEPASRDPEARVLALPLRLSWLDIGSWQAYGRLLPVDGEGNAVSGEVAMEQGSGNIALCLEEGHLLACLGCEDLVVVHTRDATLVCPRSKAEGLKELYKKVLLASGGKYA